MLIVIADDFSGAAEMGGIAHRYGLNAEVQLEFDAQSGADVLVIDADTRSLGKADAVAKTQALIEVIKRSFISPQLFKKVDSVLRGNIVTEINELRDGFGFQRVLLLPANPGRGRTIRNGQYFINNVNLDKTVFADDPDFPAASSQIKDLIRPELSSLPHMHISTSDAFPTSGLITGDAETKADIKKYLTHLHQADLCCGAAECFEAYLEQHGNESQPLVPGAKRSKKPYTLIINGSTVKNQAEVDQFKQFGITRLTLPGMWEKGQFVLINDKAITWYQSVLAQLREKSIVSISIELPIVKTASEVFSSHLVALIHYLSKEMNLDDVHIGLTGGATASAVVKEAGANRLSVVGEIEPGVVTLTKRNTKRLFTAKPGSYPWPTAFLDRTQE